MHKGTKNVDKIQMWVDTLLKMKIFAKESDMSVARFPGLMSEMGPAELSMQIFHECSERILSDPDLEEHCYEGVRNAEFCINYYNLLEETYKLQGLKVKKKQPKKSPYGSTTTGNMSASTARIMQEAERARQRRRREQQRGAMPRATPPPSWADYTITTAGPNRNNRTR